MEQLILSWALYVFFLFQSEMFQEDIFPATASSTASLSADEWISGLNRDPILISLKVSNASWCT